MNIWLDERIRFVKSLKLLPMYNMSVILKIDSGSLLINQCLRALNSIVDKHWIFRTRLTFDAEQGIVVFHCIK
jgi:hypothetical protein